MTKSKTYHNVVSLDIIGNRLGNYLQQNKYEVIYLTNEEKDWILIQTRRIGKLPSTSKKCMDIIIKGSRQECKVTINDGEWGKEPPDASHHGKIIPFEGIYEKTERIVASILTERRVMHFIDKISEF